MDHLRAVYGTLCVGLMLATAGAVLEVIGVVRANFLLTIASFVCFFALCTTPQSRENERQRFGCFAVFAFLTGMSTGPQIEGAMQLNPSVLLTAFLGTAIIFGCFSLAALHASSTKYLHLGGVISSTLMVMLLTVLFAQSKFMITMVLWMGLAVTCALILYDTQLICEKRRRGDTDYIWHTIELFLDFTNLFRYILVILTNKELGRMSGQVVFSCFRQIAVGADAQSEEMVLQPEMQPLKDGNLSALKLQPEGCIFVGAARGMVLSSVVAVNELRAALPASYLSFSMVPFASISLGMGALSWLIPRKVFSAVDNLLYSSYMRACLFVFENVASTKINFYGDIEAVSAKRESAIVLSNHQSNVDWVVITMIANRQQGNECGLRFMIKYAMHYFPLFGWYTYQVALALIEMFIAWVRLCATVRECDVVSSGAAAVVLKIAERAVLASYLPRRDPLLSQKTRHYRVKEVGREKCAPNMFEFVCGVNSKRTLHIHIRRFPVNELPEDVDALKEWLMQRYLIKNGMLEAFYNGDGLPDLAVIDAPRTPFSVTVPPSLFFAFALIAPFFSTTVRKIYLVTICSSPALILWLRLRGCV
ncbi:unnamed protein product [Toxocara canis]|uniref:Phospholipid/glycerol acyltransferase domain-containing protein n=1 Tax=Toxocara canis TaxID=6265 RepID=A0A3P7IL49_TOXCA|nr:unnamed protein product [Toxocara canis]